MPILKKHHKNKFTIIPNDIFSDANLNLRDVGLLCFLLHLPDDWVFTVNGLVMVIPNEGKDAITSSLKRLEAAGYLTRERERIGGRYGSAIWHIFDSPMTDFPAQVNAAQENPPLIKKEYNKERNKKEHTQKSEPPLVKNLQDGDFSYCITDSAEFPQSTSVPASDNIKAAAVIERAMRERLPETPPFTNEQRLGWAKALEQLRESGYSRDIVGEVAAWFQNDEFWGSRITSGETFKKNFQTMYAQMESKQKPGKWDDFI